MALVIPVLMSLLAINNGIASIRIRIGLSIAIVIDIVIVFVFGTTIVIIIIIICGTRIHNEYCAAKGST